MQEKQKQQGQEGERVEKKSDVGFNGSRSSQYILQRESLSSSRYFRTRAALPAADSVCALRRRSREKEKEKRREACLHYLSLFFEIAMQMRRVLDGEKKIVD